MSGSVLTTDSNFIVIAANGTTSSITNRLSIGTTETAKNVSISVQAFLDTGSNGSPSTFEKCSDEEDVILYAPGNVSATTTINDLAFSSETFRASVVYGQDTIPFFQNERIGFR